jgi:hypothetical protein
MSIEAMKQALYVYLSAFENHQITNAKSSNLDMTGHIAELARTAIEQAEEQCELVALIDAEILKAVEAEREACAAKAEQVGQHKNHIGIAAAIRARGRTHD